MNNNQLTDDQIKALTTVAPQEIVVNNPKVTLDNNTGETRIRATGNNEALTDGVYVKTYAVYAKDDSGNEILYGITVSPNPNYLPEYDGVTPQAVTYSYKVNISNTTKITFTNSNDVYVSDTDLDEALQPYAKTVDVNQQLDKKVNVSDMRKPASDVAGIEEVNAKQDKIGYTPADDSKVVHDNHDGTEQLNGVKVQPFNKLSDTIGGRNLLINTAQLNDATVCLDNKSNISDTYLGLNVYQTPNIWDGVRIHWSYLVPKIKTNTNYVMSEYVRNTSPTTSASIGIYGDRTTGVAFNSNIGDIVATLPPNSGWTRISAPVNIASFTTPISGSLAFEDTTTLTDGYVQFAGLKLEQDSIATDWTPAPEDKQDKIGYTPADDSKVAHLSGANNFDTVPTVDNNPLLLASSLPSDLARTGQAQTFTQPQTFSIAPTITDASKDKGDNQAATMADLKSVEDSAWRPLIQNFDTNYFQNEKYYNFNAFIKVSGGKTQIVGYLQDRSDSSCPFGTYIRLANLPSGISFQNDIDNLGVNVQGILSSSFEGNIYSAAVDGTINAHSSDNSIGIIFQKDSNFNTNVDWFPSTHYGALSSYPTWTINGMTYDIKLSD